MNKNINVIIFSVFRIICSFLLLYFLSRYLTKYDFGLYNYFIAFSTISLTILFNGFTPIYLRNKIITKNKEYKSDQLLYNQIFFFFLILLFTLNLIYQVIQSNIDINIQIKLLNFFLISGFFHHIVLQEVRSQKKFFLLSLILFLEIFIFLLIVILIYLNAIKVNIINFYVIFYVLFSILILIITKNFKRFIFVKIDYSILKNFKILIFSYFKNSFSVLNNSLTNYSFLIFIVGLKFSLEKSADVAVAVQILSIIVFSVIWVELILPIKYMDLIKNNDVIGFKIFFKNKVTKYFLIIIFFSTVYIEIFNRTNLIEILFTEKYKKSINEISILSIVAISQCFEIFISWYLLSLKKESTLMKISMLKLIIFLVFLYFGNYELILLGFALSFVSLFIIGLFLMKKHMYKSDFYMIIYFYFLFLSWILSSYFMIFNFLSKALLLILILSCIVYILANIKIYLNELKKLFNINGNY